MKSSMLSLIPILLLFSLVIAAEYDVSLSVSPEKLTAEPYSIAVFDVSIHNFGNEDTYNLSLSGINGSYSFSHDSITIPTNSSALVYLFITPVAEKQKSFTGMVYATGKANASDSFQLTVIPAHQIRMSLLAHVASCLCEEGNITLTVENTGTEHVEDIRLSLSGNATDIVDLPTKFITLVPTEKVEIPLVIKPVCRADENVYELHATAKSVTSYAKAEAKSLISKVECYKFQLSVPEEVRACAKQEASFNIIVNNTGLKEDNYLVKVDKPKYEKSFSLKPGEVKSLVVATKEVEPGIYSIIVNVNSSVVTWEATVKFVVDRCYGVSLHPDVTEITIVPGTGKLTKPTVENIGTKSDVFTVSSSADWTAIRPKDIALQPNETKAVYVYYSPEYGSKGTYETTLRVKSAYSEDEKTVSVNVQSEEAATTTLPANLTLPNITIPEVPPITIPENVTAPSYTIVKKLVENKILISALVGVILAIAIVGLIYIFVVRS